MELRVTFLSRSFTLGRDATRNVDRTAGSLTRSVGRNEAKSGGLGPQLRILTLLIVLSFLLVRAGTLPRGTLSGANTSRKHDVVGVAPARVVPSIRTDTVVLSMGKPLINKVVVTCRHSSFYRSWVQDVNGGPTRELTQGPRNVRGDILPSLSVLNTDPDPSKVIDETCMVHRVLVGWCLQTVVVLEITLSSFHLSTGTVRDHVV